jgi:ribosomal protein S3
MKRIKDYLQNPQLLLENICGLGKMIANSILNIIRTAVYMHEKQMLLKLSANNNTTAIFAPVMSVSKVLEHHYGFDNYMKIGLHTLRVDTQNDVVGIFFKVANEKLLRGEENTDIDAVKAQLSEIFGRNISIRTIEIVNDINSATE